jgi:hypothetical protein
MERTLQENARTTGRITSTRFLRGLGWGLIGGLAGTLVMDGVLMGALSAFGAPALTCFSIIGNTVARFFSIQSVETARAIQLGVLAHYLIGPLVGALFGTLVAWVEALRVHTLKKSIILAIIYVEILSQPILATTPILLKMTAPQIIQWYGGSFVMHLMFAIVLGAVVGYGLRLAAAVNHRQNSSRRHISTGEDIDALA